MKRSTIASSSRVSMPARTNREPYASASATIFDAAAIPSTSCGDLMMIFLIPAVASVILGPWLAPEDRLDRAPDGLDLPAAIDLRVKPLPAIVFDQRLRRLLVDLEPLHHGLRGVVRPLDDHSLFRHAPLQPCHD